MVGNCDTITNTNEVQNASQNLINSYCNLNAELLHELDKFRVEFEQLLHEESKDPAAGVNYTCNYCSKCSLAEKIQKNLTQQLTNLHQEKNITWTLWQESLEEIAHLEERLGGQSLLSVEHCTMVQNTHNLSSKCEFLSKCIENLQSELTSTNEEKHILRDRLVECNLKLEKASRDRCAEKSSSIAAAVGEYKKEIVYLKGTIERLSTDHRGEFENKLEKCRVEWKLEEMKRIKEIKNQCLVKLEPLIVEQEKLILNQNQLKTRLAHANKHIDLLTSENDGLARKNSTLTENYKLLQDNFAQAQEELQDLKNKQKQKANFGLLDEAERNKSNLILENLKKEKKQLEEEYMGMIQSRNKIEQETRGIRARLEERIASLEKQNFSLQSELCEKLGGKKSQDFDIMGHKMTDQISQEKKQISQLQDKVESLKILLRLEKDRSHLREANILKSFTSLEQDSKKLMTLYESQRTISANWEHEYKSLFEKSKKKFIYKS